ncbi:MAG: helix-turn-helix transcriptional regulator [Pseudomonadota bacterium]
MVETPKSERVRRTGENTSDTEKTKDTAGVVITRSGSAQKANSRNNVRKLRTERMMSRAELARRAGLSTLTIDRVEKGMPCRMDTKRKILEALGLTPADRVAVFGEDD